MKARAVNRHLEKGKNLVITFKALVGWGGPALHIISRGISQLSSLVKWKFIFKTRVGKKDGTVPLKAWFVRAGENKKF